MSKKRITAMLAAGLMLANVCGTAPLSVCAAVQTGSVLAAAETAAPSDFDYTVNPDGKGVTVTKYKKAAAELTFPENINGLPITAIGDNAFSGNETLTSVTISDTVITIGAKAFDHCIALKNLTVPENVERIGADAFANCENLTVFCVKGTYAEQYVKENNIKHMLVQRVPNTNTTTTAAVTTSATAKTTSVTTASASATASAVTTSGTQGTLPADSEIIVEITLHEPTKADYYVGDTVDYTGAYGGFTAKLASQEGCMGFALGGFEEIEETVFTKKTSLSVGSNYQYRVPFTVILDRSKVDMSKAGTYPVTLTVKNGDGTYNYVSKSFDIRVTEKSAAAVTTTAKAVGTTTTNTVGTTTTKAGSPTTAKADTTETGTTETGINLTTTAQQIVGATTALTSKTGGTTTTKAGTPTTTKPVTVSTTYITTLPTTTVTSRTTDPAYNPTPKTIKGIFDHLDDNYIYMSDGTKHFYNASSIGTEGMAQLKALKKGDDVCIECMTIAVQAITIVSITSVGFKQAVLTTTVTTVTTTTQTTPVKTTTAVPDDEYTFEHTVNEDGKGVTITKYSGSTDTVVIPDKIGGLPVTEIGSMVFMGQETLKEIVIPDTVKVIGNNAFSGCTGLTKITIPDSVTTLGTGAFGSCTGLTEVIIPASVKEIGSQAFASCTSLKDITIPETVTGIGSSVFRDTPWLKSEQEKNPLVVVNHILIDGTAASGDVKVPDGVTEIGGMAFSGSRALTSVTVPEGVKTIGESAFYNCAGLTSVKLPEGLESIGYQAFGMCSALTAATIPPSVKEIGGSAFLSCEKLETLVLPQNLSTISNSAFAGCRALTALVLPVGLKTIEVRAFTACTGLTELVIPSGTESIGFTAFAMCSGLTKVTIPESVKTIDQGAFSGCQNLTVYGKAGSAAETYAQQNGLTFKEIGSDLPLRGDVNGDRAVSVEDAQLALVEYVSVMAGLDSTFTEAQRAAGDVNGDNTISVEDAQTILLYYVTNTLSGESVTWEQLLGFEAAQYIRTSWSSGEYPVVAKITSADELESYTNAKKKLYDLSNKRSEKSYTEAVAAYTPEWFEKHQLVIVLVSEGSGSIRHTVSGVSKDQIQITRSAPEALTSDMAAWFILVELDKSTEISDQISAKLSLLDWEKK